MFDLLLAKDLHPFLDRLESLLACFSLLATEYQLRNQSPFTGDVPFLAHRLVDEGVIVLQVGAEAERLKGSPDCIYVRFFHAKRKEGEVEKKGRRKEDIRKN